MLRRSRAHVARVKTRFDRWRTRWPWLDFPIAMQERYGEVDASYVATAIGAVAFLSLFPLLVVGTALLGYLNFDEVNLVTTVNEWLGIDGDEGFVNDAISTAQRNRRAATIVGLVGLLWSGLALVGTLQHAYDRVWQVQDRGWKSRPWALLWLTGAVLVLGASIAANAVLFRVLPPWLFWLGLLVSLGTGFLLFMWGEHVLPNRRAPWRDLVPGALVGAVLLEILKTLGTYVVPAIISRSSELYGAIGVVFAIILWLMLFSRVLMYSTVANVVLWERRHGTVETTIEVPAYPGRDITTIDRSGQADLDRADDGSARGEAPADTAPKGSSNLLEPSSGRDQTVTP